MIALSLGDVQRFWESVAVDKQTGCYAWTGTRFSQDYGHFSIGTQAYYAHRLQWWVVNGPVANGKELHHRCKNKWCVNPDHLEEVTRKEHFQNHLKSHCRYGHPLLPGSVYFLKRGGRLCKLCAKRRKDIWEAKKHINHKRKKEER